MVGAKSFSHLKIYLSSKYFFFLLVPIMSSGEDRIMSMLNNFVLILVKHMGLFHYLLMFLLINFFILI